MSNDLETQGDGGGETVQCPVCGVENPANAEVCIDCNFTFGEGIGASGNEQTDIQDAETTAPEEIVCNGCGAELPGDTTSCFICGEEVNAREEEISDDVEITPEDEVSEIAETTEEDWDLGVVGGDGAAEEADLDLDLDEDLPPAEETDAIEDAMEEELDVPEDAEELPELGPNEFHCPSCSKAIAMGESKCPNCWADIPDMIRCPQCELTIPLNSDACPECFVKLENGVIIEELPLEADAEDVSYEVPDEDLMPQEDDEYEEETEEFFEEVTEVYGVECPFCRAIANISDDICPECGMPLIEEDEQPKKVESQNLKFKQPEHDWYRIIAFGLVMVLLISAIVPFAIPLPHVDREQIRIDGAFGDWDPINAHNDSLDVSNPNINIIDYKMISDAFNVYFYTQVAGSVFGDVPGDTSRIFIDVDQNSSTGYSIMGIGADYQIRVFGHAGIVESSSCMRFDNNRAQNDFNGFESYCPSVPHTAETLEDNDKFEVRVSLEDLNLEVAQPVTAIYYMGDTFGNSDYSDTPITNAGSVLFIEQTSLVGDTGIITGSAASVLSLEMTVIGNPVTIADISVPDCSATVPDTMEDGAIQYVNLTTSASSLSSGTFVHREALAENFDVPDTHVVITGQGAFAYANAAPATIQIDGAFADWAGKGLTLADPTEDQTLKNGIDASGDTSLDILEQTTALENNNINFMVDAEGDLFAGMWVPEMEEEYANTLPDVTRADTSDNDYTYSEPQVDTTRAPDLQRPSEKPEKTGEGSVKVFIDADNDITTGYIIEGIGADYLAEALGQDGQVTRTRFSTFSGTDQNLQEWTVSGTTSPSGASSGSNVEISVPLSAFGNDVNNNATAVIQLVDWNLNGDVTDISAWDIFETGTRSSTRAPGVPETGGIRGNVSPDGVSKVAGTTVVMRTEGASASNLLTTDYTEDVIEDASHNYRITLGYGYNTPVQIHTNNGTYYGYDEAVYPSTDAAASTIFKDITPKLGIPALVPENLVPVNNAALGGSKSIQLQWDLASGSGDYWIYRTNNTGNSQGDPGGGRYYGTPKAWSSAASTSFTDNNAISNQTNYYIIEAVDSSGNINYSVEVSVLADFYEPTIAHTELDNPAGALVNVSADLSDGVGIVSAKVNYKMDKPGAVWMSREMSISSGDINSGEWTAWIPVDVNGAPNQHYLYTIEVSDGTYNTIYGAGGPGDPTPMDYNATWVPHDPYPVFGHVFEYDGSNWVPVAAGTYVNITWFTDNTTVSPEAFWSIETATAGTGNQYSVDLMYYDHGLDGAPSPIWGNATNGVAWGYNETTVDISMGGRYMNIYIGNAELGINKTAPGSANPGDVIMYTVTVTNIQENVTAYNVTVTETYDAWTTFVNSTPVADNPGAGDNIWTIGSLAPGQSEVIYINVSINVSTPLGTDVINNVEADFTNITGTWIGPNATQAITTIGAAHLNITKSAPATANTGEIITYWITYTNDGSDAASNVFITETYPADVTFISSIPPADIGNNIWDIGILNPGDSNSIQINVQVNTDASGILNNTVLMTGFDAAGIVPLGNAIAWAETTIIDPMMTINKGGPAMANTGEIITYTIDYQNTGTDWAYDVVITESYDIGVTFVSAWPAPSSGIDTWYIGDLDIGESGTILVNVTVNALTGTINNTAVLNFDDAQAEAQAPVEDWHVTTIIYSDMLLNKTAPATANTGQIIYYVIDYFNIGTDTAVDVVITETYPIGVTYMGAVPAPDVPTNNVWTIGNVLPGTGGSINITVSVNMNTTGWITNWAELTFNNTAGIAQAVVSVSAPTLVADPYMQITKTGPAVANSGQDIVYTITYFNSGTASAENVVITENYPTDVTFVSSIPAPDNPGTGDNIWTIGSVPAGTGGSIQITVNIDAGFSGVLVNEVELNYDDAAAFPRGPIFDWANTSVSDPLMVIYKTAPATASPGEIIQYTITYENIGTDDAYNVVITENYPSGVNFISAVPGADIGNNVWNVGTVPAGGNFTIYVTVQIGAMVTGTLTNFINLTYEDFAGQAMPELGAFAETVITWPMMNVQKTGPATANAGDTIQYTITYQNMGTDTATNVIITETYPVNVTFVDANPMPDIGDNVWLIGDVPAGASGAIYINVTIDANATGLLVNNITMDYETPGFVAQPPVFSQWTTFLSGPYMTISKVAPVTANTGELITYTIQLDNIGDDTAENVIVTENYPAGVSYVIAAPLPTSGDNVWDLGSIADGAGITITITVMVENWVPIGTVLNNVATVDYENGAGLALPTETASDQTTVVDPSMSVTKTGPATANTDEVITYTITYFNSGTEAAYNVWINESYDLGVTFVDAWPMPDVGNYAWDIGTVASGTGFTILVNVSVDAGSGTIWNFVDMNYTDDNGEYQAEISASCSTDIINPFLVVDKTAPATAGPGQTIIYTIDYQNIGTDWAYNIMITETYPGEVTFVSAVPMPDILDNIWIIPALAPGASGTITITVLIDSVAVGPLENYINASYEGTAGIKPIDAVAWANTTILDWYVTIEKVVPEYANSGEIITYWIYYNNTEASWVYDLWINETYPAGVTFINSFPLPTSGLNSWYIPFLAPYSSGSIMIIVQVNTGVAEGTNLVNDVTLEYSNVAGLQGSDFATDTTTVIDPVITVEKRGPSSLIASPGEVITYTIWYNNTGSDTAYNVILTETYPAGVTFIGAVPAPDVGTNIWFLPDMAPGFSGMITITVAVSPSASGVLINTARLDVTNGAGFPMWTTGMNLTVVDGPFMSITKTGPAAASVGETITYTISYQNTGPTTAYNVWINDTYPGFVNYVGAVPAPTAGNNVWFLGNIAPGNGGVITIQVTVLAGATVLVNNATVDYSEASGTLWYHNWDTAVTQVSGPLLEITKTAPATANTGETFDYIISITNIGSVAADNVVVTESYPAGVSYVSASPLPTAGNNIWDYFLATGNPLLGVGVTWIIQVTVQVNNDASGILTNDVSVDYENPFGQAWPTEYATADTLVIDPDLSILKTGPATANTGEVITYTITVTNNGDDTAYNVVVTETYPGEVSFVSAVPAPDVPTDNVWNLGNLTPGSTVVITIDVQVTETLSVSFENIAYVDYESAERAFPRIWSNVTTTIMNPLLSIQKSAPAFANTGEIITYSIWVNNTGDDWAYNVEVTETYPAGTSFVSASPAPSPGNNFWSIGMMAPGGTYVIEITVQVQEWASGSLDNLAEVDYENFAGIVQPTENDIASTLVIDPVMTVTKSAPAIATHDEVFAYTITYENTGTDTAYNVVITDYYPMDVTFIIAAPMPDIGNNVWLIGDVLPGASASISILVSVNTDASGFLVNDVELDYEDSNGQAQVTVSDQAITEVIIPALTITKSAPLFANTGETFIYTITVENVGNDIAENVVVTEFYPAGISFVSALPVADIGNNIWNIGTMNPGDIVTINITVTVTATTGLLTNIVEADFEGYAGFVYPTVQDTATTQIINPDISIEKSAPAYASTGEQIVYTIWVNNIGNDAAYNVVVTETYPVGITYVSALPLPTVGNNVWAIGVIGAGGSVQIQISVDIDLGLAVGTILDNLVEVDYENAASLALPTESDSASTEIIGPQLVISKTGPAIAAPGEIIMYTLTVENIGTDSAYNVVLTETYPAGVTFINSTYPPDLGNNVWFMGDIPAGMNGTMFINVSVNVGIAGNITNTVVMDYENGAGIAGQVNASCTTLITGPFVTIQKTGPATATEGSDIIYTIVVENTGDNDAYNVVVTETYPADVTFVSASVAPTTDDNIWDLGTMAPGDIVWINITVNVDIGATLLVNNVAVNYSSDAAGNVTTENVDSVITNINNPWVEITKSAPTFANWNETIMYTITYTNTGLSNASNIWINETYSADITFVNAFPAPTSGNGTWYIANLAVGESGTIFINVTVNMYSPGTIQNYVELTFENSAGLVAPTQMAWANTTIINPMVTIIKTGPAEVNPGETFTYYLDYENTGTDWAYDVIITEYYPAGVNFVSSTPLATTGNNVWIIPALAPGANGTIEIIVIVTAASGTLFNGVDITYNNTAGAPQDPTGDTLETDIVSPDMTITKTAPATAVPGEFITYTITYVNNGDDWAYDVVITEFYPVGVSYIGAVPSPTIGDSIWQLGDISPGGSGTITITVQINNGTSGTRVNNVTLGYESRIGTIMPLEVASDSTDIVMPELTVTKLAPATANTGETIVYRVWVNNTGTSDATNIVVTETYPAGVAYQSASPGPDAGNNVWFIPLLLPGQTWFVDITVRVNDNAFGILSNLVDVTYDDYIGQAYPPESDTAATLIIDPLMDITKDGPAFANSGEYITYWVNYTNLGDDTAYNVVITESYSPDISFFGASPAPSVSNNIWNIGTVAPGATFTIEITVVVDNAASAPINNFVALDYESNVRAMPPETAKLDTDIIDPLVSIEKSAPAFANPGEIITYTITVTNNGDDWAYNLVITETYPIGVTYVGAMPLPDTGDNEWQIAGLAPGGSISILVSVMIDLDAFGLKQNYVLLNYENSARTMPWDSATADTMVIYPTLTISKTAPATASPGESIHYIITVQNTGTDAAYNAIVTDYYPPGISYLIASPLPDVGNNIWIIPFIPAGGSIVIDITVVVAMGVLGNVMNHVVANYSNSIGTYQPEIHDFVNTTILGPIMSITKDATPYANSGDTVTYWVNYTNSGTDWAYNVVITETYPAGMAFVSASPMPDVGTNVWNIGSVAPGSTGSIIITMQATGVVGPLQNLVKLDYENVVGSNYPPVWDTAITAVGDIPNMNIIKTGPAQANAGETVTFTITYTNVGNVTAYYVNITDIYPFGLSFVDSFPVATIGNNFWELGNISAGSSATILVNMTATGVPYGILSNVVQITYENTTGIQFQSFDNWQIEIVDAFIDIQKSAPATATSGDTVMYTIDYSNIMGTDTAYGYTITETYPPGSTFVDSSVVADNPGTGDNIWTIGDLPAGASGTIFINITLNAPPYVQDNFVSSTWDNSIGVSSWANDSATTILTDSPQAILEIEKTGDATVNPGGVISYVINYTNLGGAASLATSFTITETYPAGTSYLSSWPITPVGNVYTIPNVPGGASGYILINVTDGGSAEGIILTNQADYSYDDGTVVQAGTVYANTTVVDAFVTITKTAPGYTYSPQNIIYTINYENTGTDTAYNLEITENYPAGVTFDSAIPVPSVGNNFWTISAVPAGGSGTITIVVSVNALLAPGTDLDNYVWLNYTNGAGTSMSDNDMATTTVVEDVVTLDKTGPARANPGDTITYTITYYNEGSSAGPVDIMITEFYDGVTFVSATPAPVVPTDNIWIFNNVPAGSGGTIDITVTVNSTAPDIITNRVMLNYTSGATDVFLNATATTVISGPLMEITKSGPLQAAPGSTIMYTITYTNIGAGFANNVTITETYPGFMSFQVAMPAPNPGTNNVWTLGALGPGDSGTIMIVVDISSFAFGSLTNWVQVTYQNMSGGSLTPEWASATTAITTPSMVIEKSGPSIVNSGQQITYTITYLNVGSGIAANVVIEDAFPAGLSYVSSSPAGIPGNPVRWNLGNVPGGAGGTITVTFDVTGAVPFTNYAYLNYSDQSGTQYFRQDSFTTVIQNPQMTITKSATPVANSGELITYTIGYNNIGTQIAYNVVITETYDLVNVAYVTSSIAPSNPGAGDNIWNIGNVLPGNGGSFTITVMVLTGVANDTTITNNVDLDYENSAIPMPTVSDSAQTLILNPQLSIVKSGPMFANTGQTITYTIWVNNTGGAMAQNVRIIESYPAELTFIDALPLPNIGNNVWVIGDLANQDSVMITITLMVNDGTAGLTATNNVLVNYTNENGDYLLEQTAQALTDIIDPELVITKTVSTTLTNTGETITYTINVTNTGTDAAYNVVVTEDYSSWTTFLGALPAPDIGDNIWQLGTIAADATVLITIDVSVDSQSTITNWAYVDYEDFVGEIQDTESDFVTTYVRDPSMEITKTANATAVVDGYILYTITYRNMGSGDATNVMITETYSSNVTYVDSNLPPDTSANNTWTIGLVPSGATGTIYILVQVTNDTMVGDVILNNVDLDYEDLSGNTFSDFDWAMTDIIGPNMTLNKEGPANVTYEDGAMFDYYINYTNTGNWAYNVVIMDELPLGVSFVTSSPMPTFVNGSMYYWNFTTVGPDTLGIIRITVALQPGAPLNITNNVTLSYTNLVGWASPDLFDQANTTITYLVFEDPAMEIIKTGPDNADAGLMLNYTLEYWNNGTGAAYNVLITETYPTGLTFWNSSIAPTSGNNTWNLGTLASGAHGWINITMLINSTLSGYITNNVSLEYYNVLGTMMPTEYAEFITLIYLPTEAPPELGSTPPEFVFAGQNFTLYASASDTDTGIDTVILYYTDINGGGWNSIMIPLLVDLNGNGMYSLQIPAQSFKGMISYFVWANDTDGNANRTGIYDVPVRLPPYFVWGNIYSSEGISVSGAIVLITNTMTNETVMAVADGSGYYEADLATLYSGYLNGEGISIYATDGSYYGTNASFIDLDFYSSASMDWPNRDIDVVLSEIPEFTMLLTPIIGILLMVVLIRRNRRREENECENY